MARYIDAEKYESELWSSLKGYRKAPEICAVKNCIVELEEQPTADVIEVEHGRWIENKTEVMLYGCSNCAYRVDFESNYCPNCGAKMDRGII